MIMKQIIFVLIVLLSLLFLFGCVQPPICGNGVCEVGEDQNNCSINDGGDCPEINLCGNGVCDISETNLTCSSDCAADVGKCVSNVNGTMEVCFVPFHEESSFVINLDFNKLENIDSYFSLGFFITGAGIQNNQGEEVKLIERKKYSKVIANLEPDSEYNVCLNGLYKDYTSTGFFNCVTVTTETKKSSTAIILENYDVDSKTREQIKEWLNLVKLNNPSIEIKEISLNKGTTSEEVLKRLREEYNSSNLKYVVFIGFDLPIPTISAWGESIYSVQPYNSLSKNENQFLNNNPLNEISIAVIRPERKEQISSYFDRLIEFYKGSKNYETKLLIANAMIPSEGTLSKTDFINLGYSSSNIDYIGGITDYSNSNQADNWKVDFSEHLKNKKYEIFILNAHGARDYHYPCSDTGCVDSNFIRNTGLDAKFIIAISCNIGNFMTIGSPMVSYIFDSNSLAGLGAEMPYTDLDNMTSKDIFNKLTNNFENIADSSRAYGFVIIGDPFLKTKNNILPLE